MFPIENSVWNIHSFFTELCKTTWKHITTVLCLPSEVNFSTVYHLRKKNSPYIRLQKRISAYSIYLDGCCIAWHWIILWNVMSLSAILETSSWSCNFYSSRRTRKLLTRTEFWVSSILFVLITALSFIREYPYISTM